MGVSSCSSSGAVASEVSSGVAGRSDLRQSSGSFSSGSSSMSRKLDSSSNGGSDMVDDDDMSDADEDGSRGRERRRSFCLRF
jgi:hypothetical protein